jgi:hypothetical protein
MANLNSKKDDRPSVTLFYILSGEDCTFFAITLIITMKVSFALFVLTTQTAAAFAPLSRGRPSATITATQLEMKKGDHNTENTLQSTLAAIALGAIISTSGLFGGTTAAFAEDAKYDGFAEYAKDNQMEKSDVGCFMNKCGDQTKALFSNPRGIKGITCLGRCKGEQACATRCFAEYGSEDLNKWLSCTIEENECVKVPKNIDNSAENVGYPSAVKNFDSNSLIGTWYKTDGLK